MTSLIRHGTFILCGGSRKRKERKGEGREFGNVKFRSSRYGSSFMMIISDQSEEERRVGRLGKGDSDKTGDERLKQMAVLRVS